MFGVDGVDDEPDNALADDGLLEALHCAGLVVVGAERAIGIVSLKHDNFAFVIAELVGLSVDVCAGEVRGGLAYFGIAKCYGSAAQSRDC